MMNHTVRFARLSGNTLTGDDYMVVQKRRAEKAEKLKRLRDSLDAYTQDGEDDPELKKIKLYLEQISCQ